MIFNLNNLNTEEVGNQQYDLCIVGAGAAGITIADRMRNRGLRIALIEAGGEEYSEESQDSYKGKVTGDPYFDLDAARLRFLGGTTNHWGGWSRSFDRIDFERHYMGQEYIWPIKYDDVARYREESCEILEIGNDFEFGQNSGDEAIRQIKFQFSTPVNFRDKYQGMISNAPDISLFLNANLIGLKGNGGRITAAAFRGYENTSMEVRARKFVFAMGGIENSRFMLWFARKYGSEFFDTTTPIGKYWMEHHSYTLGRALVSDTLYDGNTPYDRVNYHADARKLTFYSLNDRPQIDSGILGCALRLKGLDPEVTRSMVTELLCLAPGLGSRVASLASRKLICGVIMQASWEQAPSPENHVRLSPSVDKLGVPRVELVWEKKPIDRKTIRETVRQFNQWLMQKDLGRLQLEAWILDDLDYPADDEIAGYHHMGGTRMSDSPEYGVVDGNCKVFGSENLYVAGSSVFTTGGHNNPTLPIVELSLRLADHLMET